jgi:hypothetical protein
MASFVPPLEFGNRAFVGHASGQGRVVVIDSPREIDRSDVPIDPARDIVVHGAYLAAAVGTQLLRRGFRGFLGVDAGIGRNEAGISALKLADEFGVPAASVSVYSCDMAGWCDQPRQPGGTGPGRAARPGHGDRRAAAAGRAAGNAANRHRRAARSGFRPSAG